MSLLFLILAIVLFLVAALLDGLHANAVDLGLLGLAAFAAAHLPLGDYFRRTQ